MFICFHFVFLSFLGNLLSLRLGFVQEAAHQIFENCWNSNWFSLQWSSNYIEYIERAEREATTRIQILEEISLFDQTYPVGYDLTVVQFQKCLLVLKSCKFESQICLFRDLKKILNVKGILFPLMKKKKIIFCKKSWKKQTWLFDKV